MDMDVIYQKFFDSIFSVGKEITSEGYIQMLLPMIIKSLKTDYAPLKNVSFAGSKVVVSAKVKSEDRQKCLIALTQVIFVLKKPFDSVGKKSFVNMLESQMEKEIVQELKQGGVL